MRKDRLPNNKLLHLITAPKGGINETQQQALVTIIFFEEKKGLAQSHTHTAKEDILTARGRTYCQQPGTCRLLSVFNVVLDPRGLVKVAALKVKRLV